MLTLLVAGLLLLLAGALSSTSGEARDTGLVIVRPAADTAFQCWPTASEWSRGSDRNAGKELVRRSAARLWLGTWPRGSKRWPKPHKSVTPACGGKTRPLLPPKGSLVCIHSCWAWRS